MAVSGISTTTANTPVFQNLILEYWSEKLNNNKKRDISVKTTLNSLEIRTLTIWECTIKQMIKDPVLNSKLFERIISFIKAENTHNLEL